MARSKNKSIPVSRLPDNGFETFFEFASWMRDRAASVGDNPRTIGSNRKPGLRKDKEAWEAFRNQVHQAQLRASYGNNQPPFLKQKAAEDKIFQEACSEAKIHPTRRQYTKWLKKAGKAYMEGRNA